MGRALISLKKMGFFGLRSVLEGRRSDISRKWVCRYLISLCEKGVEVST